MSREPRGNLFFEPPLVFKSAQYMRAHELLSEMGLGLRVVKTYVNMDIKGLSFPTKDQAMMFRLRL